MEYKFKVGDTVEAVVSDFNMLTKGNLYNVIDTKSDFVWVVNDKGANDFFVPTKFKLSSKVEDCTKVIKYNPLNVQQSGDHYNKRGIQPVAYGIANNLSFPQVNIVKYVTRHEDKNGIDDLAKSIHYHFFEALRVYGEDGSTQLRDKVLKLLNMEESQEDKKEGKK